MFNEEHYKIIKKLRKDLKITFFMTVFLAVTLYYMLHFLISITNINLGAIVSIICIILIIVFLIFIFAIFLDIFGIFKNFLKIKKKEKNLIKDNFHTTYNLYCKILESKNTLNKDDILTLTNKYNDMLTLIKKLAYLDENFASNKDIILIVHEFRNSCEKHIENNSLKFKDVINLEIEKYKSMHFNDYLD